VKEKSHFGSVAGGQMPAALSSDRVPALQKTGLNRNGGSQAAFTSVTSMDSPSAHPTGCGGLSL